MAVNFNWQGLIGLVAGGDVLPGARQSGPKDPAGPGTPAPCTPVVREASSKDFSVHNYCKDLFFTLYLVAVDSELLRKY